MQPKTLIPHRTSLAVVGALATALTAASASSVSAAPAAAGYHWTVLRPSPLGARSSSILVWTGKLLLELGGFRKGTAVNVAAYRPATGRWHKIAPAPRNVGFDSAVTAWTGRQLFVTNGHRASCRAGQPLSECLPRAGLYDPATNRWTSTLLPRQMDNVAPMAAAWTGREIVLASANTNRGELGVAAYNPATGHWRMITPRRPAKHPVRYLSLVATSTRVILWSLWDRVHQFKNGASDVSGIDVLAQGRNGTWRNVTGRFPQDEFVTSPVFTGRTILVSPSEIWCGTICIPPLTSFDGYFANPATLHRSVIPGGPLGQTVPVFTWTGRKIIAMDLDATISGPGINLRPDDTALYNPASNRWHTLPHPAGYPEIDTPGVWADGELLILTNGGQLLALRS